MQAIPSGVIRVGNRDARVATIVEQLAESGYLPSSTNPLAVAATPTAQTPLAPTTATSMIYTQAMAEALKGLQTDYGIAADGVVGPET